ncbi:Sulfoquinovosyl transferase SQD2 [Hibiscus syriacus]|uniref:Sulfoquinovosyl transferase SQD2 n=1 Tax=Hibiscus syriacus TaxID=106335 RepID=A0A6A3D099_HIBSY|nr:Sulfoquinovosyl transferase SQD2 [Hibiscus syriacus]
MFPRFPVFGSHKTPRSTYFVLRSMEKREEKGKLFSIFLPSLAPHREEALFSRLLLHTGKSIDPVASFSPARRAVVFSVPHHVLFALNKSLSLYSPFLCILFEFKQFFFLLKSERKRRVAVVRASETTVTELSEEDGEQEENPPSIDSENNSKPRRIALFVEPSPFSYISGYKNRFQNFIKYLREMGDEVMVVTTHEGVPQEFYGAKLIGSRSFPCPWYQKVPLSLALSPRIISEVLRFKPDIIHASSPGIMVFSALFIAKLLCVPIVMSYHTHVPVYIPRYTFSWHSSSFGTLECLYTLHTNSVFIIQHVNMHPFIDYRASERRIYMHSFFPSAGH